jgi:hypothetical protein
MAKADVFSVRLPAAERRQLEQLATLQERSKGDVVRLLIRRAASAKPTQSNAGVERRTT